MLLIWTLLLIPNPSPGSGLPEGCQATLAVASIQRWSARNASERIIVTMQSYFLPTGFFAQSFPIIITLNRSVLGPIACGRTLGPI